MTTMAIGDFSRATRLTAKTLRFYHREGLLEPARVDPVSGYRSYHVDQIADAHVIRQFRSMDMPIGLIREVLAADLSARNTLIATHLARMEAQLEQTRAAVASLRDLLTQPHNAGQIIHRRVDAFPALVLRDTINLDSLGDWYTAGVARLEQALADAGAARSGTRGGLWSTELFLDERGEAALYIPTEHVSGAAALPPDIHLEIVPTSTLAVLTHRGPDHTMAQAYGFLGEHVARLGLGADGPVRESYLFDAVGAGGDAVTEIGWPISPTAVTEPASSG
jgi:DNA-binding transcriptional MerR regulator